MVESSSFKNFYYKNKKLRTVIKRHIKDYQKVLFGVAQGVYRKPMKIDFNS